MILGAWEISSRALLWPCQPRCEVEHTEGRRVSHGLGPAGYDLQLDLTSHPDAQDGGTRHLFISPGSFLLASTVECFNMPADVIGIVHDKSSWARQGLCVQNTVIEPGWRGYLTLELTNHSRHVIRLEHGLGIAQVVFHEVLNPGEAYSGKYQDQEPGPQAAR